MKTTAAQLFRVIVTLTPILVALGCAPNIAYRTAIETDGRSCAGTLATCANQVWHRLPTLDDNAPRTVHPVHLGFVEFDDQGALHRPDLKDAVIERVRVLHEHHPLLIVVFAHGWKHNASAADSNVSAFADLLRFIAREDERVCRGRPCADRHVVGVYLGWRGLSASVEPLKSLSFWARKSRAGRVGTDGAMEVLADLKKIDAGNANSRLILAGHSFGGALIYTAIQQQLMRDTAFLNRGSVARQAADLIVLVNPAFEAARFRALHRRGRSMEHSRTQRPILAVFTSRNDTATSKAFPLGRGLSTLFQSHTSAEQRTENFTTLGHYEPYMTHDLNLTATAPSSDQQPLSWTPFSQYRCAWQNFQSGVTDTWSMGDLALERRPVMQSGTQRQNPYLNVSVDPGIIAGHSDIWGERFSQFLYRFVAVQSLPGGRACAQ